MKKVDTVEIMRTDVDDEEETVEGEMLYKKQVKVADKKPKVRMRYDSVEKARALSEEACKAGELGTNKRGLSKGASKEVIYVFRAEVIGVMHAFRTNDVFSLTFVPFTHHAIRCSLITGSSGAVIRTIPRLIILFQEWNVCIALYIIILG